MRHPLSAVLDVVGRNGLRQVAFRDLPEGTVPDANGYMAVELRHNAEGDRQEYPSSGYVSFPLLDVSGYKEGKLQGFKIKMNTINNGEETVTVSYNKSKSTNFPFIQKGISNTKTK